ncbi:MAG: hypothetical protein ACREOZ_00290, partial [Gloeomargaritales cyanobacterium]
MAGIASLDNNITVDDKGQTFSSLRQYILDVKVSGEALFFDVKQMSHGVTCFVFAEEDKEKAWDFIDSLGEKLSSSCSEEDLSVTLSGQPDDVQRLQQLDMPKENIAFGERLLRKKWNKKPVFISAPKPQTRRGPTIEVVYGRDVPSDPFPSLNPTATPTRSYRQAAARATQPQESNDCSDLEEDDPIVEQVKKQLKESNEAIARHKAWERKLDKRFEVITEAMDKMKEMAHVSQQNAEKEARLAAQETKRGNAVNEKRMTGIEKRMTGIEHALKDICSHFKGKYGEDEEEEGEDIQEEDSLEDDQTMKSENEDYDEDETANTGYEDD